MVLNFHRIANEKEKGPNLWRVLLEGFDTKLSQDN